jgi:hypothetical protein
MKIGLVGQTYQQRSLPFNAQRTINFWPVFDEQGKEASALYGTPGLSLFSTFGPQPHRQCFTSANGRSFFVAGSKLYEVFSNGTTAERGTLLISFGNVSMDENSTQLGVCDGKNLYTLTYSNNTFAQVTDSDLPENVGFLTVIDSYFVIIESDTEKFWISAPGQATNWAALEFASAESNPDKLVAAKNALGQLWLFGEKTTEIWTNTGASNFSFRRISGAIMEVGIAAAHSVQDVNNSVYWLGRDKRGSGIVYRANGFVPEIISAEPINILLQRATNIENITSWAYQEEGHTFYALTGGGLETTLVLDVTTSQWHERSFNNRGDLSPHLGQCVTFAFGKQLVGDRRNGNVYEMSLDYYDDAGEEIVSERIYTHLSDMDKRIRYNALEISMETGVGNLTGNGQDPLISMQLSKDGARTWSNWFTQRMGKVGEYLTKVVFRRLGIAEQMTFKIRISAPVKKALTGSYLR